MLPMCYPADHNDGVFIPNWALWFVVELEEYLARSGDRATVDALRPRVLRLLDYFKKFRNDDGLLEKLESWVFVEWSAANDFVQDVNYPSNMLYAKALAAAGRMYGLPELTDDAERIRETIRRQSFEGEFFVDNAIRVDGKLQVTTQPHRGLPVLRLLLRRRHARDPLRALADAWSRTSARSASRPRPSPRSTRPTPSSATCCGSNCSPATASASSCSMNPSPTSSTWPTAPARSGRTTAPTRAATTASPRTAACTSSTATCSGLAPGGHRQQGASSSASPTLRLDWCEGRLPTPDGPVELRWRKDGGKLLYQVTAPAGYTIKTENRSSLEALRQP